MKLLIAAALSLLTVAARADICAEQNCTSGRTPTDLCFVSEQVLEGATWLRKLNAQTACGGAEMHVVSRTTDMFAVLDEANRACKSVGKIIFQDHGKDGSISILDLHRISGFSKYACLMQPNAVVDFSACDVGRGCSGDLFMSTIGHELLAHGGTVVAPEAIISSGIPGLMKPGPLNGVYRLMTVIPGHADQWSQKGLLAKASNGGTLAERCEREIDSNLAVYNAKRLDRSCDVSDAVIPMYREFVEQAQRQLHDDPKSFPSSDIESLGKLVDGLGMLDTQAAKYRKCR